eukprot:gene16377-19438_t
MQSAGVDANTITYSALINVADKAGEWRQALSFFQIMQAENLEPSSITYNQLANALWSAGERRRAILLIDSAVQRGMFAQLHGSGNPSETEMDLHHMSAGAAQAVILRWLCWIDVELGKDSPQVMARLGLITGWGKHSKTQGECSVKDQVCELLEELGIPFTQSPTNPGKLFASRKDLSVWLDSLGKDRGRRLLD